MDDYVQERDGRYWITGTHTLIDPVVLAFLRGDSVETIVQKHSSDLTLALAYGVLAYYFEHRLQIDDYLKRNE